MLANLTCPTCGHTEEYSSSDTLIDEEEGAFVMCCMCYGTIPLPTEWVQVENKSKGKTHSETTRPVLEEGESVIIVNEEHPWSGQIALVCGFKYKHVRIELLGKKIWVPDEWIQRYESH